jgi:hypothetical protein
MSARSMKSCARPSGQKHDPRASGAGVGDQRERLAGIGPERDRDDDGSLADVAQWIGERRVDEVDRTTRVVQQAVGVDPASP